MNKLKVYLMVELTVNVVDLIVGPATHGATLADEFVFPGAWVDVHGSSPVVVGVAGMTRPRDLIYMDVSVCTKVHQITEQSLTQAHVTTGGTRAAALRTSVM